MPAIVRPVGDERDSLLTFLAHERHVLVIAAYGLTDEQAWSAPTASELSIASLLEHMTSTERTWASMIVGGAPQDATDEGTTPTRAKRWTTSSPPTSRRPSPPTR